MGELEAIRTFLTVAEHSSFSAAARLLGMTPASVTRTISALEDNLGVQLLLRTTRKVSLTSAGAPMRPVSRRSRKGLPAPRRKHATCSR